MMIMFPDKAMSEDKTMDMDMPPMDTEDWSEGMTKEDDDMEMMMMEEQLKNAWLCIQAKGMQQQIDDLMYAKDNHKGDSEGKKDHSGKDRMDRMKTPKHKMMKDINEAMGYWKESMGATQVTTMAAAVIAAVSALAF